MPKLTRHEIGELAAPHLLADIRDLRFQRWLDAAQRHAADRALPRKQRLGVHVGRRADHFRILARFLRGQLPVGHGPGRRKYFDVREHRQHAVADLFLEPVHYREHHDQRRDAKGDTRHGYQRDKRDETVAGRAFAGAGIAPADLPFVGKFQAIPFQRSNVLRSLHRTGGAAVCLFQSTRP